MCHDKLLLGRERLVLDLLGNIQDRRAKLAKFRGVFATAMTLSRS